MVTYSADLLIAVHTEVVNVFGADAKLVLLNTSNLVLAIFPLNTPAGVVDPVTGQLTISFDGRCEAAEESGTASTFEIRTSTDVMCISGPCRAGSSASSGYLTFNTLLIESGAPLEISSLTFG